MDINVFIVILSLLVFFIIRWIFRIVSNQKKERRDQFMIYLNSIIHQVNVENHHGIEYWYDRDNNSFLGQGTNFDDVVSVIKSRFPDHIFLIENRGGFCAKTNWQLVPFDELRRIDFLSSERK